MINVATMNGTHKIAHTLHLWLLPRVATNRLPLCSGFTDALILGPMVRVSTFPMRLLCHAYGADIMYGPEIIDRTLIHSKTRICASNNTICIVDKSKESRLIFKTLRNRREPVVCQIGSCDSVKFLRASKAVCKYVRGIDLNMGCPKPFSINKGIGSALLDPKKMHLVEDMLKTFHRNKISNFLSLSVKIRLLKCNKATIELCRMIESCKVDAIAIHARYREDRSEKVPARTEFVKNIVNATQIPIIYNGDVFEYADIGKYKKMTHCNSVMISRGAISNPSIFCKNGMKNINDLVKEYMNLNQKYSFLNPFHKSKFVMESMLLRQPYFKKSSSIFKSFHQCRDFESSRAINAKLKQIAMNQ